MRVNSCILFYVATEEHCSRAPPARRCCARETWSRLVRWNRLLRSQDSGCDFPYSVPSILTALYRDADVLRTPYWGAPSHFYYCGTVVKHPKSRNKIEPIANRLHHVLTGSRTEIEPKSNRTQVVVRARSVHRPCGTLLFSDVRSEIQLDSTLNSTE